ncbi:MAG: hypothetical protein CM1200mP2_58070 [Planctomycetaceae bacterium]|nr:MAG: hypothetical protein CM1200mP2_58070 [Planctomycetaceae bacterium]
MGVAVMRNPPGDFKPPRDEVPIIVWRTPGRSDVFRRPKDGWPRPRDYPRRPNSAVAPMKMPPKTFPALATLAMFCLLTPCLEAGFSPRETSAVRAVPPIAPSVVKSAARRPFPPKTCSI